MRKVNLLIFTLLLLAGFSFLWINQTKADYDDNVYGWAWAENIGWISMNCTNQSEYLASYDATSSPDELHGYGWSDNIGWLSLNCEEGGPGQTNICAISSYEVKINEGTGEVYDYAWSDNLGWLDFDPAGPYPELPSYSACLNLPGVSDEACEGDVPENQFGGWARFLNYDGWDGWVKLACYGAECAAADYSVYRTDEDKVGGWAWGGEVAGWIVFRSGCAIDYGVNIDTSTGELSGYAWNRGTATDRDGVGWIKFNPAGSYPEAPNYSACINLPTASGEDCENAGYATNTVSGWARACAGASNTSTCADGVNPEAGGWGGWIKLRGTLQGTTTEYGATLNTGVTPAEFEGWAWGSSTSTNPTSTGVIGWISFNCNNWGVCTAATAEGGPSDYKVLTTVSANQSPSIQNQRIDYETYCRVEPTRAKIGFHWEYEDPDNDPEAKFELQIDDNADFSSPVVNRKYCSPAYPDNDQVVFIDPSPSGSVTYGEECPEGSVTSTPDELSYNPGGTITYHWRVRVWDDQGNDSGWIDGLDFTTEAHAYPWCAWTYTPEQPPGVSVEEVVLTINNAECYDINNNPTACQSYYWEIPNPPIESEFATGTATSFEPQIVFYSPGDQTVTSIVTDPDTNSCACPKTIPIGLPLPEWKEIAPVSLLPESLRKIVGLLF